MLSRDLIQQNFWLKLSSLILASLIWFTVFATQNDIKFGRNPISPSDSRVFAHVPVRILGHPGDARFFTVTPSDVSVSVRGSPNVLRNLGVQDLAAVVNVTQFGEGHGLSMKVQVFSPNGVTIESVRPLEVRVEPEISNPPAVRP